MPGRNFEFREMTRVQMPALVHLNRIGYTYFGKISETDANVVYDPDTNILLDVFKEQFAKLNPDNAGLAEETLSQIRQELDYDDLGKSFYKRLIAVSPVKLIDFDNPKNNVFHYTAEFYCINGQDSFRPDITLFVNGLPLAFIEVKKPNNDGGMTAESNRMNKQRFPNRKFRRFINITQLMIFSNNMEYDAVGGVVPIQGAFYCTGAREKARFSCFREENPRNEEIAPYIRSYPYSDVDKNVEKQILFDYNCGVIQSTSEYATNLNFNSPTNRILTSMCSPERLLFILKYGIAYVHSEREVDGKIESVDEKHIVRYQQMFALLAVRQKLSEGVKSGVIWHTQGSGKTALSYHMNYVLTDFYAKQNKVAKFYFIVDRLDLLKQAKYEFEARGLIVKTANTRNELMEQFRTNQSLEGNTGENEITVVNIQRFAEDSEKVRLPAYATNLQRIFIVDEAHRGYKPEGSFLANLFEADPGSIKIALTGTPLLKEERASWKVFGEYLHTYYYDKSIQDGYTLKIIREDIETSYRDKLAQLYDDLNAQLLSTLVHEKDVPKKYIIEHDNYVKELLRYIIADLKQFRTVQGDSTLGGMIICETSDQARKLAAYFDEVQSEMNESATDSSQSHLKAGLILYDSDDKDTQDKIINDFKRNMTIDILIVYNMLLTGFDAPRLKRLYFGRKLKDHNLLQAITRVNRPYGENRYGFIIDFADIKANFDATNEAYMRELNRFNDPDETGEGNATDSFVQVIEDKDELVRQMNDARQVLFDFTTDNVEEFCSEVTEIEDKQELIKLRKALVTARDCCNIVRTFGDNDLKRIFSRLEIRKVPEMIKEVQRRIDILNQRELFDESDSSRALVNEAMQDITFSFKKIDTEELKLISGGAPLKEKWSRVISELVQDVDHDNLDYITLQEAFMKRFKEHGFTVDTIDEYNEHTKFLDEIIKKLEALKKKNDNLLKKYNGDVKFVRIHNRIKEENAARKANGKKPLVSEYDERIVEVLSSIKKDIDQKVYDRNDILKKDAYFERTVMEEISKAVKELSISTTSEDRQFLQSKLSKQYIDQYKAAYPAE